MADPHNRRMPPVGVKLTTDVERRVDGFRARVRWTDPATHKRVGRVSHVRTAEEVEEFFGQMRAATETGNNTTVTLADYAASIGDRWQRGLDPTSTAELYDTGLRLRVLPAPPPTPTGPGWPNLWAGWAHWKLCWKMPPPSPAVRRWMFPAGLCWCSAPTTAWWLRA